VCVCVGVCVCVCVCVCVREREALAMWLASTSAIVARSVLPNKALIYVYIYIYVYICIYIYARTYIHTLIYAHKYITCARVLAHIYIITISEFPAFKQWPHMYIDMRVYIYTYM